MRNVVVVRTAVALYLLSPILAVGGGMVPQNILSRAFSIRTGPERGTAFTIEVDGRQYLITARHVAEHLASSRKLEIFQDSKWKEIRISNADSRAERSRHRRACPRSTAIWSDANSDRN